jgi:hypothetical protein
MMGGRPTTRRGRALAWGPDVGAGTLGVLGEA